MIKCPQCESPCPQGPRDTVLFCGCSWKYEGVMADGERKDVEGRVDDSGAYDMERRSEKGTIDVLWKSLVISASK
jgi:hypothetical protein